MASQLLRRLRATPPTLADGLLALALMVFADRHALESEPGHLAPLHLLTIALITLPVTFRRVNPVAVSWAVGSGLLLNLLAGYSDSFFETFALLVSIYTMVAHTHPGPLLWATLAADVLGLHVSFLIDWHNKGQVTVSDLPYNYLIFAVTVMLGYSLRTRRANIRQLEEASRILAREAAAEERTRIARELHDVVAHNVGVMVLQATAGSRLARRDPATAAGAFDVIQETGRRALTDLRRVVGVLRAGEAAGVDVEPQPGLAQLESLVDEVRRAGVPVELRLSGERRALAPAMELSAYRIVQESLTNVLKHAGASHVDVEVSYGESELRVEVIDDGRGANAVPTGGSGLTGMRERVRLFGGELFAGGEAGGFRVSARLPFGPEPA